jgi:DNA polymerase III sliding clamp (beta) subunit (PCNA family)
LKSASVEFLPAEMAPFEAIISSKTAKLITDTFDKSNGPLRVSVGSSLITVAGVGVMIISKLISGSIMELEKQLPKSFASECVLNREELEAAFKRALSVTGKEIRGVIFRLEKGEFHIFAKGELGNGEESLTVQDATGNMKGCVDAEIMTTTLKSFEGYEQVRFLWNDPLQPFIFAPIPKDGESTYRQAVVVPLRSKEL